MTDRTAPEPQDMSLPGRQERLAFATAALAAMPDGASPTPELLAEWTAGMTLAQMADVLLRAKSRGTAVTQELVREYKAEAIQAEDGDMLTTGTFDEVGGMDQVKRYFAEVIEELRAGTERPVVPEGGLLAGDLTAEQLAAIARHRRETRGTPQ